nr:MAG TPA: nucelotide kinase [Caudoviricetes sp.]
MINMDQFIMAGLIGAIVVIVCYTTIQVIDIIDNRKHKTVYMLTPGRLYERPNRPPSPPVRLPADETLKRLAANENLKRLQEVSNQSGLTIDKSKIQRIRPLDNQNDDINHPSHYTQGDIEVIDYIEDKKLGYRLGNVVKYVSRAGHKDDAIKDLKKARWYLNREIAKREDHDKSRATIN